MEFRILGPLELSVDGAAVALPVRRRERCLLGLLLLEPDQAVPAHRLISLLWEDREPPAQAQRALHSHIARLRAGLAALPVADPPKLVTVGSGYAMRVAPEVVDAQRFRAMVARARGTADADERAGLLRGALDLWRGPVLDGSASTTLRERVCRDLAELRLVASEDWLAAELALGRHRDRIADLASLVAEHPDRERLLALYLVALDRCGRTSDALRAYDERRRRLAEHEGLDPGPELREVHATILRGESGLPVSPVPARPASAQPPPAADDRPAGPAGPAQLPPETVAFVGRRGQLAQLDEIAADQGRLMAPIVVTGMGGVGKTALVLRWAHRVAPEFPDGQLYFDLRGHDQDAPAPTLYVLGVFLRALGAAPTQIPGGLDEAASLYRTMTAGCRVLVVLDNAADPDQVRALLPSGPGALVLVTSRDRMLGLAARDGARLVALAALPPDEAVRLLGEVAGADRVGREPIAAAALAAECGHLPLALRITGAELQARPDQRLSTHLTELRRSDRLSRLAITGDARSAVRSAINLSHRRLDPAAARLFRLLAVVPGADFDRATAAAAAGLSAARAADLLDRLVATHMLDQTGADRYAFHDLVREYARELAGSQSPEESGSAVRRLYLYFRHRGAAAAFLIDSDALRLPDNDVPRDDRAAGADAPRAFPDAQSARSWLDRELPNLVAVIGHAAEHGPDPTAWLLADALRRHLWQRGNAIDALAVAGPALRAATAAGDQRAVAAMEISAGQAEEHAGQYQQAIDRTQRGAAAARRAGWSRGEAAALTGLGELEIALGRLTEAETYFDRALRLSRRIRDAGLEAECHNGLGGVALQQGRTEQAATHYRAALARYETVGSAGGAAVALNNLGEVSLDLGRLREAIEFHTMALKLYREAGRADGIAFSLVRLATANVEVGQYDEALTLAVEGLDVIDRTDLRYRRVPALTALGAVARCKGDLPLAVRYHEEAVNLARELGLRFLVADALVGLGMAHLAAGRTGPAGEAAAEVVTLADAGDYRLLASQGRTLLATVTAEARDPEAAGRYATEALEIARSGGLRLAEAQALEALARVSAPERARELLTEALTLLTEMGSAAADGVRAALNRG